jgi:hypothetical protein
MNLYGGRRRRTAKGKKVMKGGDFYGFTGPLGGTTAGAGWGGVANTANDPVTGGVILDGGEMKAPKLGGRRRRTSKKTKKGGRKSRKVGRKGRKTMRGGGWNPGVVNVAGAGYGYGGNSIATSGPPDMVGYASRVGGAPMNAAGVRTL